MLLSARMTNPPVQETEPSQAPAQDLVAAVLDFFENRLDKEAEFKSRPAQREMAIAVARAIETRGRLAVEAGTGTGKSLAYLVPLLLRTDHPELPAIIATKTVQLQQQLLEKDLPVLQRLLDTPRKVVQAKGWNNYACWRKIQTPEEPTLRELGPLLHTLHRTMVHNSGRLTRMESDLPNHQWNRIKADPLDCQKRNCPHFAQCGLFLERRELETAEIVVTNHAFLLTDLRLKREGRGLLPLASVLVLDEAHRIDDVATEHLAVRFDTERVHSILSAPLLSGHDGWLAATRFTFLMTLPESDFHEWSDRFDRTVLGALRDLDLLCTEIFMELKFLGQLLKESRHSLSHALHSQAGERLANLLSEACMGLEESANDMASLCKQYEERFEFSAPPELVRLGQSVAKFGYDLQFLLECESEDWVYMLETDHQALVARPVDNAEALQTELYSDFHSVIVTSASLRVADSFHFFKRRTGLTQEVTELTLPSPFDFENHTFVGLADSGPEPGSDDYPRHLAPGLLRLVVGLEGRTMLLTTSHRRVQEYEELLRGPLSQQGIRVLAQGRASTAQLLRSFTSDGNWLLIGVDTFWEGVDIPGERLSCVVMTRFPFPVPSDVLFQARAKKVEAEGGNSFDELSLPLVGLKLKQGFGRLLRVENDRGIFLLTDPRAGSRWFGKKLVKNLPCRHAVRGDIEELVEGALTWAGRAMAKQDE